VRRAIHAGPQSNVYVDRAGGIASRTAVGRASIVLIAVACVSYRQLGSGLLPALVEGGFILDYVMPPVYLRPAASGCSSDSSQRNRRLRSVADRSEDVFG
jgi:hypothetical protein